MPLSCGIVGLPNVGKSTIFSALTSIPADAENYPFCTIEPNVGIIPVPDIRLQQLAGVIKTKKIIPTAIRVVDIAGLVQGASKGEGRGNQFLGHIRETEVIIHVVRCFQDSTVVHVDGDINPLRDIETINIELILADITALERRTEKLAKDIKSHNKVVRAAAQAAIPLLEKLHKELGAGKPAGSLLLERENREILHTLHLLTAKPMLYVCNISETESNVSAANRVEQYAAQRGEKTIHICGKLEAEIAGLESESEREEFLQAAGLREPGLASLIRSSYAMLGLQTFFTAGENEIRAWTIEKDCNAKTAAGKIHSDMEKGFICAEVFHIHDILAAGSEQAVRQMGRLRQEGKDYIVKDGDVIFFRFNT